MPQSGLDLTVGKTWQNSTGLSFLPLRSGTPMLLS
jgi:hypothetical protein